jgi:glycosyltransferase involved in cell wall biosynthesis
VKVLLATPGTDVGGAERVVITLARELPRRGHEVVLWGPAGALEPELADAPVARIVVADRGRSPVGVAEGAARLAAAIRRARPQLVHAHNPRVSTLAGAAARLARGPRRPPVLATFHGVRHEEYRVAAVLLRAADAVACVSPDVAERLRDAGMGARRLRVVTNGVAVPATPDTAALDAELGLAGKPVVLAAGRLVAQKNHARYLDAAERVAAARPDVRFLLAGDGPLRGELAARGGPVTLLGVRHDLPALLARADVVVFSSDWEGLPLVALEALAAGTPVISTPVEGTGDLAHVVEPTAPALAAAVLEHLDDPERLASLGERGRAHVAEHHSPAAMVDAYEALYLALSAARAQRS